MGQRELGWWVLERRLERRAEGEGRLGRERAGHRIRHGTCCGARCGSRRGTRRGTFHAERRRRGRCTEGRSAQGVGGGGTGSPAQALGTSSGIGCSGQRPRGAACSGGQCSPGQAALGRQPRRRLADGAESRSSANGASGATGVGSSAGEGFTRGATREQGCPDGALGGDAGRHGRHPGGGSVGGRECACGLCEHGSAAAEPRESTAAEGNCHQALLDEAPLRARFHAGSRELASSSDGKSRRPGALPAL
mmetsp:Transcript_71628/g.158392  ORF Transcript_71628/g.158392 Transcript_71628/m.158392 type:complete len:250 (-) Transcript_71628:49-798(-)